MPRSSRSSRQKSRPAAAAAAPPPPPPPAQQSQGGVAYILCSARSPLSFVFLIHVALEAPLVIQAFLFPTSLPFMQMTDTTLVLLRLYAVIITVTCIAAALVFQLPEYHFGKRALAIALCVYHSIASMVLFSGPRFIQYTFGSAFESLRVTPENVWGAFHGVLGLLMEMWRQTTLQYAQAFWVNA